MFFVHVFHRNMTQIRHQQTAIAYLSCVIPSLSNNHFILLSRLPPSSISATLHCFERHKADVFPESGRFHVIIAVIVVRGFPTFVFLFHCNSTFVQLFTSDKRLVRIFVKDCFCDSLCIK